MKIRTDFVTNSSSSSFILGFKSESTIHDELARKLPEKYLSIVLNNIEHSKRMNADEAIEYLREELYDKAYCDVMYRDQRFADIPFTELSRLAEYGEGKDLIEAKLNQYIDSAKERMEGFNVFAEVTYEDHTITGSALEHD